MIRGFVDSRSEAHRWRAMMIKEISGGSSGTVGPWRASEGTRPGVPQLGDFSAAGKDQARLCLAG